MGQTNNPITPSAPNNPNPPTPVAVVMPNGLCVSPTLHVQGQAPLATTDIFQTKVCLYNDTTKQYEQYFQYVTVNPDNTSSNFYLYENLGNKLNILPVGKIVPCVQDVHVVNDSGKIYETVDCNNTPAVKTFDSCTLDMVSKVSSGIAQVSSTLSTINSTIVSELGKVSSGITQVSSGLMAISSTLNAINGNIVNTNSTITAVNSTLVSVDSNVVTVTNTLSSTIIPILQQTRDHQANAAANRPETSVTLLANVPTKILNASNRRVAVLTWYSSTNPRAILNLGFNGTATVNKGTALAFRQSYDIHGWLTKGEVWGISSHDIVLNITDFTD
jgi:hypothetical protein